jgi:hypothetical protein
MECKPVANLLQFERSRPKLKHKPVHQLSLLPESQPPTQHREPPISERAEISRHSPKRGKFVPLHQAIDYDKLTVNEQMKWDAGMYGSVHLRTDLKTPYYCVRWKDPVTKKHRSTKLDSDYNRAIAKLKLLVHPK